MDYKKLGQSGVLAVGALALTTFSGLGVSRVYARSLWQMAVPSDQGGVAVTATVIGPTKEEYQAFMAASGAVKGKSAVLPLTAGNNSVDFTVLLVGEAILASAFFYLARQGRIELQKSKNGLRIKPVA